MAKFVVAGVANCPDYAKAELLADDLVTNLPNFCVHKIVKSKEEWAGWLKEECEKRDFKHERSPIVWRELVQRGGKGYYIGGHGEFIAYAQHYYGTSPSLDESDYHLVAQENASRLASDVEKLSLATKHASKPLKVVVTSAAGEVAYQLLLRIGSGDVFRDQEISLCLLDSQDKMGQLEGVAMETIDCAFPLVRNVQIFCNSRDAFRDSQAVFIIDEESGSLTENAQKFKDFGKSLGEVADPAVKIVTSGLHSLPLTSLLSANAPLLPTENFTVVSRLLERQAKSQIAKKLGVNTSDIRDVIIWGSNRPTMSESDCQPLIDSKRARVHNFAGAISGPPSYSCSAVESLHDSKWLENQFNELVLKASQEVDQLKKGSPAVSESVAIAEHMRDWWVGRPACSSTSDEDIVSVGLISKGWFDTPVGVVCSFPVRVSEDDGGTFVVAEELEMNEESKGQFDAGVEQLMQQQNSLKAYCP